MNLDSGCRGPLSQGAGGPWPERTTGRRTVEAPLHSPRWAALFTACAVLILAFGFWTQIILPGELLSRAEDACQSERARAEPGSWPPIAIGGGACWDLLELRERYSLMGRWSAFAQFTLPGVMFLVYLARRLRARTAAAVLRSDPRAPVIYLRSFQSDVYDKLLADRAGNTAETRMVDDLERLGPVLAIGRPGERLASLGAARLRVSDDQWQEVADRLMSGAAVVVFRVGFASPGLRWELERARAALPANRVVLWFPVALKEPGYSKLRELIRAALKTELPERCPTGFVAFEPDWRAREAVPERAAGELSGGMSGGPFAADLGAMQQGTAAVDGRPIQGPASLSALLDRLELDITEPPAFRPYAIVWLFAAVWLAAMFAVPGDRWSFGLDLPFQERPRAIGLIVEGGLMALLALALAFVPYLRWPANRWLPSLVICAVLGLDGWWIVQRMPSVFP